MQATINGTVWLDRDYDGAVNATVDWTLAGIVLELVQVPPPLLLASPPCSATAARSQPRPQG